MLFREHIFRVIAHAPVAHIHIHFFKHHKRLNPPQHHTGGAVRIIKEGNAALVERLGRYRRTLTPGLTLIVPVLDSVVLEDSMREQTLDIPPQRAITKDNVNLEVDAIIYWRIYDLEKTYYAIENVEFAMQELVITTLRSEVGKMDFQSLFSSRESINRALLDVLDARAATYVKTAKISEAQADVESMRLRSQAREATGNGKEVLHYLLAQRYVAANQKIGESDNSKVLFMDPKALTEGLVDLINEGDSSNPSSN